jgi:ankyrin repeat protein
MTKPGTIIMDMLILGLVSTIFVAAVNAAFSGLKKKGAKSDPVVTAILQADTNAVAALLNDPKTELDKPDNFGRTPLLWAAYANYSTTDRTLIEDKKRAPIVRMLLGQPVNLETRDRDGWTALMWASWSGLPQVVGVLLDHGAGTSVADRQGNTALILAAQRGNAQIVKMLLAKGADKTVFSRSGKSVVDLVRVSMSQYPDRKDAYSAILVDLQ